MKKQIIGAAIAAMIGSAAFAADVPQKYVQPLGDIGLVSVAGQMCDGFSVNQEGVVAQYDQVVSTAKADGLDDGQIKSMMDKIQSDPSIIQGAMVAFGDKYSVKPGDTVGFCAAMKQEQSNNKAVASMLN